MCCQQRTHDIHVTLVCCQVQGCAAIVGEGVDEGTPL
jgi:hypothetical protein